MARTDAPKSDAAPADPDANVDGLRELVRRHRVRLSVYRDFGPDERWHQQPVGFDVELRATVASDQPFDDEGARHAAFDGLLAVARWALRVLESNPRIDYRIDDYENLIVEPGSGPVEVELAAHLFHRNAIRRPLDDSEREALDEVRARLRSLGVRD